MMMWPAMSAWCGVIGSPECHHKKSERNRNPQRTRGGYCEGGKKNRPPGGEGKKKKEKMWVIRVLMSVGVERKKKEGRKGATMTNTQTQMETVAKLSTDAEIKVIFYYLNNTLHPKNIKKFSRDNGLVLFPHFLPYSFCYLKSGNIVLLTKWMYSSLQRGTYAYKVMVIGFMKLENSTNIPIHSFAFNDSGSWIFLILYIK